MPDPVIDPKAPTGETVAKADFDAKVGELDKIKQDLEDMRMEVLSPEYLDFLNNKGKPPVKEPEKSAGDLDDEKLEKLSKKEILELATKRAEDKVKAELDTIRNSTKKERDEDTKREVAAFARLNPEYSKFRPIMYGLSLDPKNANLTLPELLKLAKDHVSGIHTETTEAEKERQRKFHGEKPGGGSGESFEELKKLSPQQAANAALNEVKEQLGPIPAA